jgi:hypothetical protein
MGIRETGRNEDAEKASQNKQNKADTKSKTTFEDRRRNCLGVAMAALLASSGMIKVVSAESSSSQVKELVESIQHSTYESLAKGYVPSPQQMEQAKRWYEERGMSFDSPPDDARRPSREETSQAAENLPSLREPRGIRLKPKKVRLALDSRSRKMTPSGEISPTHQGEQDKNKGKEHFTSDEKQIEIVRAVMKKAETNPKAREHARQLLERWQSKEQESSVPRRELEPPDNTKVCLDVQGSNFEKEVLSPTPEGIPGQAVRAEFFLNVKNKCNEQADHADFIVTVAGTCPLGSSPSFNEAQAYRNTKPSSIPAGGQAGQESALFAVGECLILENGVPINSVPPASFTATVLAEAIGHDSNKDLQSVGKFMNLLNG